MTDHLIAPIVSLTLLAAVTAACTVTDRVATATTTATGEGSALAKESHADLAKGQLMGTGVGAAAGAVYDVRKRR